MKQPTNEEVGEPEEPTPRARRACFDWLKRCLDLGWPKTALDDLEKLWWKYHDNYGRLIK